MSYIPFTIFINKLKMKYMFNFLIRVNLLLIIILHASTIYDVLRSFLFDQCDRISKKSYHLGNRSSSDANLRNVEILKSWPLVTTTEHPPIFSFAYITLHRCNYVWVSITKVWRCHLPLNTINPINRSIRIVKFLLKNLNNKSIPKPLLPSVKLL